VSIQFSLFAPLHIAFMPKRFHIFFWLSITDKKVNRLL